MKKMLINKNDNERVLLTELLPYETPIIFSNEGLYKALKNGEFHRRFGRVQELQRGNTKGYTIPFDYKIKRTNGGSRKLSIIHPLLQFEFIDFYSKYSGLILTNCSQSPFSLRYPSKIAKYCYSPELVVQEDTHLDESVEVEPFILNKETKLLKSYFAYSSYDLINKFFDSREFTRLEQRYNHLLAFDISKCFYNIYTHSICWAVKSKEYSKRNSKFQSFENSFDRLMQKSNYNETNGIIVGPEISRLFAEIILQNIDSEIEMALLNKSYRLHKDYEIKRYMDDYYVFSNDKDILNDILGTAKEKLEDYKLYVNPIKTEIKSSPFVHDIAVCRFEIEEIFDKLYDYLIITSEGEDGNIEKRLNYIYRPSGFSRKLIKQLQYTTKRNDLTYDIISKKVISINKRILNEIIRDDKLRKDKNSFVNVCLVILELVYFAYSMDIRVNTTYKLSQLIIVMCKAIRKFNAENKHIIYSKIFQESDYVMTLHKRKSSSENVNIEILNLLISLSIIDEDVYRYSSEKLEELLGVDSQSDYNKLNYFELVSILYFIKDIELYGDIREKVEISIINKICNEELIFSKAEHTCLFFDTITCPYITKKAKKQILCDSRYANINSTNTELNDIISKININRFWFVNWSKDIDLERVLKKKEWGSSY